MKRVIKSTKEQKDPLQTVAGVIHSVRGGNQVTEALVFKDRMVYGDLNLFRRSKDGCEMKPVGLRRAMGWLSEAHSLAERRLVEADTWEESARAAFFDLALSHLNPPLETGASMAHAPGQCPLRPISEEDASTDDAVFYCHLGENTEVVAYDKQRQLWHWDGKAWNAMSLAETAQWYTDVESALALTESSDCMQMGRDAVNWFQAVAHVLGSAEVQ